MTRSQADQQLLNIGLHLGWKRYMDDKPIATGHHKGWMLGGHLRASD